MIGFGQSVPYVCSWAKSPSISGAFILNDCWFVLTFFSVELHPKNAAQQSQSDQILFWSMHSFSQFSLWSLRYRCHYFCLHINDSFLAVYVLLTGYNVLLSIVADKHKVIININNNENKYEWETEQQSNKWRLLHFQYVQLLWCHK